MNQPLRVAYQGEPGAFSENAVLRLLGERSAPMPFRTFEEMFDSVGSGEADCCVTPIENSLAGSIHRNYDLLLASRLSIVGETHLRIVHNLIAAPGATLDGIRRVYSHPVALAQCARFFRERRDVEAIPVHDTAGAVRLVMDRRAPDEAAIASDRAAEIYGGNVLVAGIEDNAQNFTRFFLAAPRDSSIAPASERQTSRWKTSMMLRIANKPGALFRALGAFAIFDIDLSKIESRPIEGRPWEYAFYLDIIGNPEETHVARALENIRTMAETVTILGTYQTRW